MTDTYKTSVFGVNNQDFSLVFFKTRKNGKEGYVALE